MDNNSKEARTLQINSWKVFHVKVSKKKKVTINLFYTLLSNSIASKKTRYKAILQGSKVNREVDQNTKNEELHRPNYFELCLPQLSKRCEAIAIENPGSRVIMELNIN